MKPFEIKYRLRKLSRRVDGVQLNVKLNRLEVTAIKNQIKLLNHCVVGLLLASAGLLILVMKGI